MAQHPTPQSPPLSVYALMLAAFSVPREPRSDEYKAGVRAALELFIEGKRMPFPPPFPLGTAAADAYLAGVDEGRAIRRSLQAQAAP